MLLREITSLRELGIRAKGSSRARVVIWVIGGDAGGGVNDSS